MESGFSCPPNHSNDFINIAFPVREEVRKSDVLSNKMFGDIFLEERFREEIGVCIVESSLDVFNFVGKREVDFDWLDIHLLLLLHHRE